MTVFFLCPHNDDIASGGTRRLYQWADLLLGAGQDAAVIQGLRGFAPSSFEYAVPVIHPPVEVTDGDLLVLPEWLGQNLATAAPGIPRISLNQNAYYTFTRIGYQEPHPYSSSEDLLGVAVVSEDSRRYVEYGFSDLAVHRIHYGLDPSLYHAGTGPPSRTISFM